MRYGSQARTADGMVTSITATPAAVAIVIA
jgi:hypothetical protein